MRAAGGDIDYNRVVSGAFPHSSPAVKSVSHAGNELDMHSCHAPSAAFSFQRTSDR